MGTRKRILIVDDEPRILDILNEFFRTRYEVVTASNPAQGMFIASHRRFDVILLDINMPGMSGLEMAAAIRAHGNTAAILFMTGYPSRQNADEARKLGAVACLDKPTNLLHLDELISSTTHRQSAPS